MKTTYQKNDSPEIEMKTLSGFGSRQRGCIIVDGWKDTKNGRFFVRSDDGFCTYRIGIMGEKIWLAMEIKITGRALYSLYPDGPAAWIRCRVTIVGDGEPNEIYRGYVRVS